MLGDCQDEACQPTSGEKWENFSYAASGGNKFLFTLSNI
jgi:hypothetical protein